MEIEQLDAIGAEPAEAFVALAAERLGPAVGDHLGAFVVDAALRGDHHLVAAAAERAADEVFALAVRAVDVGRVEMIDADVEALLDGGDAVGLGGAERRHAGDRPAAERDRRNQDSRLAESTARIRQQPHHAAVLPARRIRRQRAAERDPWRDRIRRSVGTTVGAISATTRANIADDGSGTAAAACPTEPPPDAATAPKLAFQML